MATFHWSDSSLATVAFLAPDGTSDGKKTTLKANNFFPPSSDTELYDKDFLSNGQLWSVVDGQKWVECGWGPKRPPYYYNGVQFLVANTSHNAPSPKRDGSQSIGSWTDAKGSAYTAGTTMAASATLSIAKVDNGKVKWYGKSTTVSCPCCAILDIQAKGGGGGSGGGQGVYPRGGGGGGGGAFCTVFILIPDIATLTAFGELQCVTDSLGTVTLKSSKGTTYITCGRGYSGAGAGATTPGGGGSGGTVTENNTHSILKVLNKVNGNQGTSGTGGSTANTAVSCKFDIGNETRSGYVYREYSIAANGGFIMWGNGGHAGSAAGGNGGRADDRGTGYGGEYGGGGGGGGSSYSLGSSGPTGFPGGAGGSAYVRIYF